MDRMFPPGTNQASEEQLMNLALATVKEVSIQDVAQGPYPLRVADHLATSGTSGSASCVRSPVFSRIEMS